MQTPVLMQTRDLHQETVSWLRTVYKGQFSRSEGHRAGVITLQIKLRDLWNLITYRIHSLFYPYHICNKDLQWGPRWVVGCQSLKFPNKHFRSDSYVPVLLRNFWPLFLDNICLSEWFFVFFISGLPVVIPFSWIDFGLLF